jgi:hypothetical protein
MSDEKDPKTSEDFDQDRSEEKQGGPIIETVKKLFSVGVGAAFMTEESIRNYLADLKLPKEVLNLILQSANKGKEELVSRVGKEIGGILSHIDIVKEASKFAENHKFRVSAEIEVIPKKKHTEEK